MKKTRVWKWLASIGTGLAFLFAFTFLLGGGSLSELKNAEAAEVTVAELIQSESNKTINPTNLDTLYKRIANSDSATHDSIKASLNGTTTWEKATLPVPKYLTSRQINGNAPLYVNFGGIEWAVVYVTTAGSDGKGDLIATLMTKSAIDKNNYNWNEGSYKSSTSKTDTYPFNMYSSSFVRVKTLNAGDPEGGATQYASHIDSSSNSTLDKEVTKESRASNQFAKFTLNNVSNSLTKFLAKPSQLRYQAIQSWAHMDYVQHDNATNCNLHNEAYETPTAKDNWFTDNYLNTKKTAAIKAADWKEDYLWLPSLTEVGCNTQKKYPEKSGVWCTQNAVRSAVDKYLCRTGGFGSSYVDNLSMTKDFFDGSATALLRPCLHLNLTALENTRVPVPKDVTKEYTGSLLDVTGEDWYKPTIHGNSSIVTIVPPSGGILHANEDGYTVSFSLQPGYVWNDGKTEAKTIKYYVTRKKLTVSLDNADGMYKYVVSGGLVGDDEAPEIINTYYQGETQLEGLPQTAGVVYTVKATLAPGGDYKLKDKDTDADPSFSFELSKMPVDTPTFSGGSEKDYDGSDLEFILAYFDADKICPLEEGDITSVPSGLPVKIEADGSSSKVIVKDAGAYKIDFKLKDPTNNCWGDGGGVLNFTVKKRPLTLQLEREAGKIWQFETQTKESFIVTHDAVEGDKIDLDITYKKPDGGTVVVWNDKFTTVGNKTTVTLDPLDAGTYTIIAKIVDKASASNDNGNYTLVKTIEQEVTVVGKKITISDSDIKWRITDGQSPSDLTDGQKVTYTGKTFTVSIDTTDLSKKGVIVKEYTGDQSAQNSGSYSTSVVITKISDSYDFEDTTFTVTWDIVRAKFNLTNVKWNYTEPIGYTGYLISVKLLNVPNGLSVDYQGDFKAIDVSGTTSYYHAYPVFDCDRTNYIVPENGKSDSYIYEGTEEAILWDLPWQIKKGTIETIWDYSLGSAKDKNNNEFNYPKLSDDKNGAVEYEFHEATKQPDGSYVMGSVINLSDLMATPGQQFNYFVQAVLTSAGSKNYELATNNVAVRFTIGQKKTVVTVQTTAGGTYDGNPKPVEFTFDADHSAVPLSKEDFVIAYFDKDGNPVVDEIGNPAEPVNAGDYTARISITGEASEYYYIPNGSTVKYTIEKCTIDFDGVAWNYSGPFEFKSEGGTEKLYKVELTGFSSVAGVTYTNNEFSAVGTYTATATVDTAALLASGNYNEFTLPDNLKSIEWVIEAHKLTVPKPVVTDKVYDGEERDLIALCGLDEDWAEYMTVSVQKGINAVGTKVKDAGTYAVVCTILGSLHNSVIWENEQTIPQSSTVTIPSRVIKVVGWAGKPSLPKFEENVAPFMYSVTYKEGETVVADPMDGLHYGKTIRATVEVPTNMTGNVIIVYDDAVKDYDEFIIFNPSETKTLLPAPELEDAELAYTYGDLTFTIQNWKEKYYGWVDVIGSESPTVTQEGRFKVNKDFFGEGTVYIQLKGDKNVMWKDADGSGSREYIYELKFKVVCGSLPDDAWVHEDAQKTPYLSFESQNSMYDLANEVIEYEYLDVDGFSVKRGEMVKGEQYTAVAKIKSKFAGKFGFGSALDDTTPYKFTFGVIENNPDTPVDPTPVDPGNTGDDKTEETNQLPIWQLIVTGVSAVLLVVCAAKAFTNYSKAKAARKEAQELATTTYAVNYAFAPLPLLAIEFLGIGETPWTIIAFVTLGLFLAAFAAMLLFGKKRKAAELLLRREQARIAEEKEYAREEQMREEQQRRDNEMKMMFAALQQGMQPMQYGDMQNMIASTVSALLPGLQQQMALPPAPSDQSAYNAQNAYSAPQQGYGAQPNYGVPQQGYSRSEADELRAQMAQQQRRLEEQMSQQQELINKLLQNQAQQPAAPAYNEGYAEAAAADDATWIDESDEVVSLEELYGNLSDDAKRCYYEIGSYIMGKPRTSQNDGKYAVLFRYSGKTLFKLCIKEDAPVLYYVAENGEKSVVRIVDAASLEAAKTVVDKQVRKTDGETF